jgi:hypothetical protein
MLKIDTTDIDSLERGLDLMADKGIDFAIRNTVNSMAFDGMNAARENVEDDFVLRNPFTKRSIQFRRASSLNNPESATGSVQDYMETQELGGTVAPKGGAESVSIPTGYASGEEGAMVKKRLPRPSNRLRRIHIKRSLGKSNKERNARAIRSAASSGRKFVYLKTAKTKGIFRILGRRKNLKLKMVHDLRQKTVTINKKPWLAPATRTAMMKAPRHYQRQLQKQLIRAFKI